MKKVYLVLMIAVFAIMASQKEVNHIQNISQSEYAVSVSVWALPSLWRDNVKAVYNTNKLDNESSSLA